MNKRGFTIIEITITLAVSLIAIGMLLRLLGSVVNHNTDKSIHYDGDKYSQVPSKIESLKAVQFHQMLDTLLAQSNAFYVFGGNRSNPLTVRGRIPPLKKTFKPLSMPAMATTPFASSILNFQSINSAQLVGEYENAYDDSDFSIVMLNAVNDVSAMVHVRRYSATVNNASVVLYESKMFYGTGLSNSMAYHCYYPSEQDSWDLPVGATHHWYRIDNAWNRYEEGPTLMVFPDPTLLSGKADGVSPFSRYSYFKEGTH